VTEVLTAVAGKLQIADPKRDSEERQKHTFAALVRKAYNKPYPADLILHNGSVLMVDTAKEVFYSSRTTDELIALLRSRRRLEGKVVPVADPSKAPPRLARWGIKPRPLNELLWLTGLVAGAGESLGGWAPGEPVRLSRWPDFAKLPYRQSHLKMAAMLTAEGALPGKVAEACEVDIGDAADFLNACAEIGILQTQAPSKDKLKPEDSMRTTMRDAWRSVVGTFKRGEPE